jgi:hypothetical protein
MSEETTIYEKDNIKITNLRAVFAEKTYSVSNITSVETKKINPSGCLPAGLICFGLVLFVYGASDLKQNIGSIVFGLLLFGLVFIIVKTTKPSYAVSLTTAAGEVKAYSSLDQATIKQIVEALNTAIIQKG